MWSPVEGARVSSDYQGGFRSSGGHSGIDFAAPTGTAIRAFADGYVVSASYEGAYGNLVKVMHTDGTVGYYAHMSAFGVQPGQQVRRGDYLGDVGSTGNSTGPHAHVEVRRDGQPVNPTPWLEGSGSYDGQGSMQPNPFSGMPAQSQMPDVVQYRSPSEVLSTLVGSAMGRRSFSTLGGGFLDSGTASNTPGIVDVVGASGINSWIDREQFLLEQRANALPEEMVYRPGAHSPSAQMPLSYTPGGGAMGDFDRLVGAIAEQESGGNYSARNGSSGALGKYQIMPGNIPSWSKEALGYSVSTEEFLRNPELQDNIARFKLNQYYQKYGASGAALAWYAGEGAMSYSSGTLDKQQGKYPSMNDYVRSILRKAGL